MIWLLQTSRFLTSTKSRNVFFFCIYGVVAHLIGVRINAPTYKDVLLLLMWLNGTCVWQMFADINKRSNNTVNSDETL